MSGRYGNEGQETLTTITDKANNRGSITVKGKEIKRGELIKEL